MAGADVDHLLPGGHQLLIRPLKHPRAHVQLRLDEVGQRTIGFEQRTCEADLAVRWPAGDEGVGQVRAVVVHPPRVSNTLTTDVLGRSQRLEYHGAGGRIVGQHRGLAELIRARWGVGDDEDGVEHEARAGTRAEQHQ